MKNVFALLLVIPLMTLKAQIDYKKLVPPNPNVASIMKPVLTPVTEYAGVPNIIYSLWNVKDETTKDLMIEFYKQVLKGNDFASSLRKAKLKYYVMERTL